MLNAAIIKNYRHDNFDIYNIFLVFDFVIVLLHIVSVARKLNLKHQKIISFTIIGISVLILVIFCLNVCINLITILNWAPLKTA